ncbi:reverse transcriptase domain-containing protein [Tanacetum coccineum]
MKSKHSRDDYLYCFEHTAKLVQEQWVDIIDHDGEWTEEEGDDPNKVFVVSFYPRTEPVEPLEWIAPENRLKPSSVEPPKLELKELSKHLEYDFLQENNQLLVVISSALSSVEKTRLLEILERLAGHEYYCFLDGFSGYFQILVAPEDQEKTTFTCPYGTFTYKQMPFGLCNALATFQRCMTAIFHELIEDSMEEGIVHGYKISGSGIEVDKAKIEAISKLPYPTNVKAIRIFLGHAGFYRRFIKDFSQIARPMTQLLVKDASSNFSEECIQALDTLNLELTQALIMIKPNWSLPFKIMCDAKFDIEIRNKEGAENIAADHLSRLENPDLGKLTMLRIRT